MKVLKKKPELCIACHACESACANAWFKEDNAEKSCIRINENAGENSETVIVTCTQCGECMPICPIEAITRDKNGIVRVNKKICVGCFMCVGFCPELAMVMQKDYIEPFKCVSCGICAKSCPTGAIYISSEEATSDKA